MQIYTSVVALPTVHSVVQLMPVLDDVKQVSHLRSLLSLIIIFTHFYLRPTGKLGLIKPPTSGKIDHSYTAKVTKSTSTTQCFDFYYYITEATGNAKLEVSWEGNGDLDAIVTVEANPAENKWQHSRTTFTVPPSTSTYDVKHRTRSLLLLLSLSFCLCSDFRSLWE